MKFRFSYLMLIMALAVAATAGYYSVFGLSQLFAGASLSVIIMASILEVGKVVTTTILHKYWAKLAKGLKFYLTTGVIVLMLITSAGIYGFLSNAYQITANKLEMHEGQLNVLNIKKSSFEKNIEANEKIVATKNKRIDQLTNLRNNQETRLDSAKNNGAKYVARTDIKEATKEIQKLSADIDALNIKNNVLADSVNKYNSQALELEAGSTVAADVGPLKYISELTGIPMNRVVNYLILLLIFVFDPLAIALILATNRAFDLENDGKLEPNPDGKPIEPIDLPKHFKESLKEVLSGTKEEKQDVDNDNKDHVKPVEIQEEPTPNSHFAEAVDISKLSGFELELESKSTPDPWELRPMAEEMEEKNENLAKEPVSASTEMIKEGEDTYDKELNDKIKQDEIEVSAVTTSATTQTKKEPVIPTGKVELEDIKEIKENKNRGYSVPVPTPNSNTKFAYDKILRQRNRQ